MIVLPFDNINLTFLVSFHIQFRTCENLDYG